MLPQAFPTVEEWSEPPLLQQLEEMLQRHGSRSGGALSALASTYSAVLSQLQQCGDGSRWEAATSTRSLPDVVSSLQGMHASDMLPVPSIPCISAPNVPRVCAVVGCIAPSSSSSVGGKRDHPLPWPESVNGPQMQQIRTAVKVTSQTHYR